MTAESSASLESLNLAGGRVALDLVNSINPRAGAEEPIDYLADYERLVRWAVHASVIPASHADPLLALAAASPRDASRVWWRAIDLREALFRVCRALAHGERPAPSALAVIDEERRRTDARTSLVARDRGPNESSSAVEIVLPESGELEAPLWSLVRSAVKLLTETDPTRLRVCPVEEGGCGWIVLDETRNRSRRWCDMRVCGNHAKAARLTARRREARARTSGSRSTSGGSS
jgi:predicted RNA-binding Zn ribbon-like protein